MLDYDIGVSVRDLVVTPGGGLVPSAISDRYGLPVRRVVLQSQQNNYDDKEFVFHNHFLPVKISADCIHGFSGVPFCRRKYNHNRKQKQEQRSQKGYAQSMSSNKFFSVWIP